MNGLLERLSDALGGEQGMRNLRDAIGIPSFCYKSPIGWIDIIAQGYCILRVSFSEESPSPEPTDPPRAPVIAKTVDLLDHYFAGEPIDLSAIPVELVGTDFQKMVWNVIRQIPYGDVRSYKWVAEQIGKPKAVQAVGSAVGANPAVILNPCHRVIRSSGALGGYGGGLERKRQLLALEGHPIEQ